MEDAQKQALAALGLVAWVAARSQQCTLEPNKQRDECKAIYIAKALKKCKTMKISMASLTEQVKLKDEAQGWEN